MKPTWFNIKKNFKILLLAISLLLIKNGFPQNSGFYKENLIKYNEAINYLTNNSWIIDSLCVYKCEPAFTIAIAFPEIIRYNSIQNLVETSALEVLYVQYGKAFANFSIGRFQIKPSFAENLEQDYLKLPITLPYLKIHFNNKDNIYSRIERLKRLSNDKWQLFYLYIFTEVLNYKYKAKTWKTKEEKLKFYATAYNTGYNKSEISIINESSKSRFYTTFIKSDKFYNYASISVEFYSNKRQSYNCHN